MFLVDVVGEALLRPVSILDYAFAAGEPLPFILKLYLFLGGDLMSFTRCAGMGIVYLF